MTIPRPAALMATSAAALGFVGLTSLLAHRVASLDAKSGIPSWLSYLVIPALVLAVWAAIDWLAAFQTDRALDRVERELVDQDGEDPETARAITRSLKRYLRES